MRKSSRLGPTEAISASVEEEVSAEKKWTKLDRLEAFQEVLASHVYGPDGGMDVLMAEELRQLEADESGEVEEGRVEEFVSSGALQPNSFDSGLSKAMWKTNWHEEDAVFLRDLGHSNDMLVKAMGLTNRQVDRAWEGILKSQEGGKPTRGSLPIPAAMMGDHLKGGGVAWGALETAAGLKRRWRPNYSVLRRTLEEIKVLRPDFAPRSIMDFGCGSGASSIASIRSFPSISMVHGVDRSLSQRQAFEAIVPAASDLTPNPNSGASDSTRRLLMTPSFEKDGVYDLVVCTYTMSELQTAQDAAVLAERLYEKVPPGGVLVLVEPGNPLGFRNIIAARRALLGIDVHGGREWDSVDGYEEVDKNKNYSYDEWGVEDDDDDDSDSDYESDDESEDSDGNFSSYTYEVRDGNIIQVEDEDSPSLDDDLERESDRNRQRQKRLDRPLGTMANEPTDAEIIAPCSHKRECPIFDESVGGGTRVHMCNFSQMVFNERTSTGRSEYFSYLVVRRKQPEEDGGNEAEVNWQSQLGRLVRNPKKKKKHVILDTCSPAGIIQQTVTKGKFKRGLYRAARKATGGGLFPNVVDDSDRLSKKERSGSGLRTHDSAINLDDWGQYEEVEEGDDHYEDEEDVEFDSEEYQRQMQLYEEELNLLKSVDTKKK